MENLLIAGLVVLTVLVLGMLLLAARTIQKEAISEGSGVRTRPRGFGVSSGISIGAGFGVALGVAMGQIALGIPIGAAIGAVLGGIWEQSNRIRPMFRQERRWFKWLTAVGIMVLAAGVVCFMLVR